MARLKDTMWNTLKDVVLWQFFFKKWLLTKCTESPLRLSEREIMAPVACQKKGMWMFRTFADFQMAVMTFMRC